MNLENTEEILVGKRYLVKLGEHAFVAYAQSSPYSEHQLYFDDIAHGTIVWAVDVDEVFLLEF